ncbi:MAG TPA: transglycosylase SLT domain-containing protein [Thermoanaerobaculia bacterium]|nr:transglycosylase SLT domain-containing protein [Thermoanaerobaculia bacterium]
MAAGSGAEDARAAARREDGPGSPDVARLTGSVEPSEGLAALRLQAARAAEALAADDLPRAAASAAAFDAAPLGLPTLGDWLRLAATDPGVLRLLAYAAAEPFEPFARDALGTAARKARTAAEKNAVRDALLAHDARGARGLRATVDRGLALARVAANPAEARALRLGLARAVPDASERASDIFDAVDLAEWNAALRTAPEEIRLARALALVSRAPKDALALVPKAPATAAGRLDAAEVRLAAGETKDALRLLRSPAPLAFADEAPALRARALELVARMRLLLRTSPAARAARRAARPAKPPPAPRPLSESERRQAGDLLERVDQILGEPLRDADRRRILSDGARLGLLSGRREAALRLLSSLVLLDPSAGTAADELFRSAFEAYRAGRPAEAAGLFDEIGALYREPALRRRAAYWSARSRAKAGDDAGARPLFAALVPGTSPDVYARWAADALGVALPEAPARPVTDDASPPALSAAEPESPARELLACELPDLAADAAEAEGLSDPVFHALLAAERGDHRLAAVRLKQRWPELGTPEEGSVPPAVRRLFYPLGPAAVIHDAATSAGLPEALVLGLIRQESVFSTDIRSRAGAVGLMQLMPATGRALHRRESGRGRPDLRDPAVNVHLGVMYLKQRLDQFDGDVVLALAAYNAGPGRARRWKKELRHLPADEFVEAIPASETRAYVKRVLFFQGAYAALYGLPPDLSASPAPGPAPVTP